VLNIAKNVAQLHQLAGLRVSLGVEQSPKAHLPPAFDGVGIEERAGCAPAGCSSEGMPGRAKGINTPRPAAAVSSTTSPMPVCSRCLPLPALMAEQARKLA